MTCLPVTIQESSRRYHDEIPVFRNRLEMEEIAFQVRVKHGGCCYQERRCPVISSANNGVKIKRRKVHLMHIKIFAFSLVSLAITQSSLAETKATKPLPPCSTAESYTAGCVGSFYDAAIGGYEGAIKRGLPNGEGRLRFPTGFSLEATFKDGKPTGVVVLREPDQRIRYRGTLEKGTYYYEDGLRYEGEVKQFAPDGNGTMFFRDGTVLKGTFEKGNPVGEINGKNSESIWRYNFQNGVKTGFGFVKFNEGIGYVGQFSNNKKNGFGTTTYPDGYIYIGEFLDEKLNGWGMMISPNEDFQYIGQFKENAFVGEAAIVIAGELVFEGTVLPSSRLQDKALSTEAQHYIFTKSRKDQFRSACEAALLTGLESVINPCIDSMSRAFPDTLSALTVMRDRRQRSARLHERTADSRNQLGESERSGNQTADILMRLGTALMKGDSGAYNQNGAASTTQSTKGTADNRARYTTIRLSNGVQIYCSEVASSVMCR
jgi:hypothetical protein